MKKEMKQQNVLKKGFLKLIKCKTLKNKVYSLLLIIIGIITIPICDGDITVFLLLSIIGIMLFFDKDNRIK